MRSEYGYGFMVGFLLQWPTLATLVMFPVLVWMYRRLAIREERDVAAELPAAWAEYAVRTPRFLPHLGRPATALPTRPKPEGPYDTP